MVSLVTISLVSWNSERFIERCINHIFKQTYSHLEIIVVDNASQDNSVKMVEKCLPRVQLIVNKSNRGYSGGHNQAIDKANGKFVLCLNPDVYLDQRYIEIIVSFLEANAAYGGAIGKIIRGDQSGQPIVRKGVWVIDTLGLGIRKTRQFYALGFDTPDQTALPLVHEVFGVDGMAPVFRKSMLEDIALGGEIFDEDFVAYCEDQDLAWRARLFGWRFACVADATSIHTRAWKPGSILGRRLLSPVSKRMALRNHYWTIIKNDSLSAALYDLPFILFRAIGIIVYALLFERSTLRAYYDVLKGFHRMFGKRDLISKALGNRRPALGVWFE